MQSSGARDSERPSDVPVAEKMSNSQALSIFGGGMPSRSSSEWLLITEAVQEYEFTQYGEVAEHDGGGEVVGSRSVAESEKGRPDARRDAARTGAYTSREAQPGPAPLFAFRLPYRQHRPLHRPPQPSLPSDVLPVSFHTLGYTRFGFTNPICRPHRRSSIRRRGLWWWVARSREHAAQAF